jgi:acetyl esterase/lipase
MTRIDSELSGPLAAFLDQIGGSLDLSDIPSLRAGVAAAVADADIPARPGVDIADMQLPDSPVTVRVYRPSGQNAALPVLLWVHGGGLVIGNVAQDDLLVGELVDNVGCAVVSVEYRLAPEHPYPVPLEDCYAALRWVAEQPDFDRTRIAVGGASAGAGLAAALALLARDRADVWPMFQLLLYPMLDDRNIAPASALLPDTLVWSRENNRIGWNAYLGGAAGSEEVPRYAAAARVVDLAGLPPAYVAVGELDLFLDEDIDYARRLLAAGVPTELHVYPGAYHGFDAIAPQAGMSRRLIAERDRALKEAFGLNKEKT